MAGTSYTLGSSAVASQVSSLNGGGVGEVVTLLLGMNNEAAGIVTGEEADSVFYGVVQTAPAVWWKRTARMFCRKSPSCAPMALPAL